MACPTCRAENPTGARFCNGCGAALIAPRLEAERKVITALFCDLVGFTATSEGADPEDVDRMLTALLHDGAGQIELHGGVVEKFIGDAVVGVFGVPVGPRATIRSGPSGRPCGSPTTRRGSRPWTARPLRLRIGINTGEALVRLDVAPGAGERFLAGDSVNTASRIQSVAPELGVAVGEETWRGDEDSGSSTTSCRRPS